MTVKEIYRLALHRIGEREGSKRIDNIILSGINAAMKLIAMKNKITKSVQITPTAPYAPVTLPNDFVSLVFLVKPGSGLLSQNDYMIDSDILMVTNPRMMTPLTMHYNFIPPNVSLSANGNEEPPTQSSYHGALAAYACYYYYIAQNNTYAASACLKEFEAAIGTAMSQDEEYIDGRSTTGYFGQYVAQTRRRE